MNSSVKIANKFKISNKLKVDSHHVNWLESRLCDVEEWESAEFQQVANSLMRMSEVPKHRKIWEFATTLLALERLELLNKDSLGISIAAGAERILFDLANKVGGIVATDIYGDGHFADLEANQSFLVNQKQFAPFEYVEENLCAAYSDALDLQFGSNIFDFAISMSSIEHFGGVEKSRQSLKEMGRVLRPGGYAIIATEFAINNYATDQVFLVDDIEKLLSGTGLELLDDFSFRTSEESIKYLCDMRKDDLNIYPHINLKNLCSIFTSGLLILKKEGQYHKRIESDFLRDKSLVWEKVKEINSIKRDPVDFSKLTVLNRIKRRLLYIYWCFLERFI